MRSLYSLILALMVGLKLSEGLAAAVLVAQRDPNIIIILTDDQGYADVGLYGAKGFKTPHLDRLAREGMRFTDFHVAQPVCSELYDMRQDPEERHDLAAQHPDVVHRLEALADTCRDDLGDSLTQRTGKGLREPGRTN
jgi:hypothetical protein